MLNPRRMTAIIEREDDGFVALCPELDIASQGDSVEKARANLVEALQLFFETLRSCAPVTRRGLCHAGRGARWVSCACSLAERFARFSQGTDLFQSANAEAIASCS
jgi:predicted RNase H-like HicB family nuclease